MTAPFVPFIRILIDQGPDATTVTRRTYCRDGEILEERYVVPHRPPSRMQEVRARLAEHVKDFHARRAAWLQGDV